MTPGKFYVQEFKFPLSWEFRIVFFYTGSRVIDELGNQFESVEGLFDNAPIGEPKPAAKDQIKVFKNTLQTRLSNAEDQRYKLHRAIMAVRLREEK